jgi:hypothetical protein
MVWSGVGFLFAVAIGQKFCELGPIAALSGFVLIVMGLIGSVASFCIAFSLRSKTLQCSDCATSTKIRVEAQQIADPPVDRPQQTAGKSIRPSGEH